MVMNDVQKQILLKTARDTVEAVIKGVAVPEIASGDLELNAHRGCFVTLKNKGRLRGCIGRFVSAGPLIELVVEMAKSSSTDDPRFVGDRITVEELDRLDVEISVLSELELTDDPLGLRVGVDGIFIKSGCASGCFLPQVATEAGWGAEEFLSFCCVHKAGLAADAWKDPQTQVYLFSAEVFGAAFRDIDD